MLRWVRHPQLSVVYHSLSTAGVCEGVQDAGPKRYDRHTNDVTRVNSANADTGPLYSSFTSDFIFREPRYSGSATVSTKVGRKPSDWLAATSLTVAQVGYPRSARGSTGRPVST